MGCHEFSFGVLWDTLVCFLERYPDLPKAAFERSFAGCCFFQHHAKDPARKRLCFSGFPTKRSFAKGPVLKQGLSQNKVFGERPCFETEQNLFVYIADCYTNLMFKSLAL